MVIRAVSVDVRSPPCDWIASQMTLEAILADPVDTDNLPRTRTGANSCRDAGNGSRSSWIVNRRKGCHVACETSNPAPHRLERISIHQYAIGLDIDVWFWSGIDVWFWSWLRTFAAQVLDSESRATSADVPCGKPGFSSEIGENPHSSAKYGLTSNI